MEAYKNLKKGTKVAIIVMALLICVGVVNVILSFSVTAGSGESNVFAHIVSDAVMYVFIIAYALFGYKKAHGNSLRTVFFVFGAYIIVCGIIKDPGLGEVQENICRVMSGLATLLIGYIAGRLDRIEKNRVLMVIAGAFILVRCILVFAAFPCDIIRFFGVMEQLIIWASIGGTYAARYEQHKAAGLKEIK